MDGVDLRLDALAVAAGVDFVTNVVKMELMRRLTSSIVLSSSSRNFASVSSIGSIRIGAPISRNTVSLFCQRSSLIKSSSKRRNSTLSFTNKLPASNALRSSRYNRNS